MSTIVARVVHTPVGPRVRILCVACRQPITVSKDSGGVRETCGCGTRRVSA